MAIDNKSEVFAGQEGSGRAQLLDPRKALQAFDNVNQAKAELARANLERDYKAMDAFKEKLSSFESPWLKDVDEVSNDIAQLQEMVATAQRKGQDPRDPSSDVAKQMAKAQMAIEAKTRASKAQEKAYQEAMSAIGNPDYDQDHLLKTLEQFNGAPGIKERSELSQNFMVPNYDFISPVENIPLAMDQTVTDKNGVTTTIKEPREEALDFNITLFQQTPQGQQHYNHGKQKGLWTDPASHRAYVKEMRVSMGDAGRINKQLNDPPKSAGAAQKVTFGNNFTVGGGSGVSGDWQFSYVPMQTGTTAAKEIGAERKGLEIGIAYKDKNAPKMQVKALAGDGSEQLITFTPTRIVTSKDKNGKITIHRVYGKKHIDTGLSSDSGGKVDVSSADFQSLPETFVSYWDNESAFKAITMDPNTNQYYDPLQSATDYWKAQEQAKPTEAPKKAETKPAEKPKEKKVTDAASGDAPPKPANWATMTREQKRDWMAANKAW